MAVLFEGRAIQRTDSAERFDQPPFPLYRWRVEKGLQGVVDGALVDTYLAVYDDPSHRMSGDIGPRPALGARYRVGAYRGGEPVTHLLFTNSCGGSLELLEALPPTVSTRPAGPLDTQGPSVPAGVISGLGVVLTGAVLASIFLTTRRRGRG